MNFVYNSWKIAYGAPQTLSGEIYLTVFSQTHSFPHPQAPCLVRPHFGMFHGTFYAPDGSISAVFQLFESRRQTPAFQSGLAYRLPSRCCSFPSLVRGASSAFKSSQVWLCRFCFLTDIRSQLNELNLKLLITNMEAHVRAFEAKLILGGNSCTRETTSISLTSDSVMQSSLTPKNASVCCQPCGMNFIRNSQMCFLIRKSSRSSALLLTFPMATPPLICN